MTSSYFLCMIIFYLSIYYYYLIVLITCDGVFSKVFSKVWSVPIAVVRVSGFPITF